MRVIACLFPLLAWSQTQEPPAHQKLIPTLWTQTSIEWTAACLQSYRTATVLLDQALRDRGWSAAVEQSNSRYAELPPAVILDVDETVLDNAPGQARQVAAGAGFVPAEWDRWVREAKADAIPGAVEFCRYAAARNVRVFFVTNRDHHLEEATRANLARHGFPLHTDPDTVLCRGENGWTSEKSPRRELIGARYRVLLLIGDDAGDFLPGVRATVDQRRQIAAPYSEFWGRKWILLPNPSYGSWEQALYDSPPPADGMARLKQLERWLNPAR